MEDPVVRAIVNAPELYGSGRWELLDRRDKAAAIYHQLCRLDSGCQRDGSAWDAARPPCPAPDSFRRRRHCPYGGDQVE